MLQQFANASRESGQAGGKNTMEVSMVKAKDTNQLGRMMNEMSKFEQTTIKKNEISLKDKIVLGPIDRYKKYNHFPWKLIIHLLMIGFTSLQVITVVRIQTDIAFNAQELYLKRFMTAPWDGSTA